MVFHAPGQKPWDRVPDPTIDQPDAIVPVDAVTICGTDLHILRGDVPEFTPGRILGHEAVGTIVEDCPGTRSVGKRILLLCINSCGTRPFTDTSTYPIPDTMTDEQMLMLADILPTGYEVGVLNGGVRPGDTVVIGPGPIGLAAISTARLYSPARIIAVDLADSRLASSVDCSDRPCAARARRRRRSATAVGRCRPRARNGVGRTTYSPE